MRFLRHLAVVVLLVGVIVGLGAAWNKFAPSTLLGYQPTVGPVQFSGPAPGPSVLSNLTNPLNLQFLRQTVVIEVLILAGVIILDLVRRRLRRLDRAREPD